MPEYEHSGVVDAEPDELFDYLADVENMPEYLPIVTEANVSHGAGQVDRAGERADEVVVEADIHGDLRHAEGWLRIDALERRMEWGAQEGPYHGWLQVEPGDFGGSDVTIHVFQDHDSDAEDDLAEVLDNIRRLVSA